MISLSDFYVEHFISFENCRKLREEFGPTAWVQLLLLTCQDPPVDLLNGETY